MNEIALATALLAILLCWVITHDIQEKRFTQEREAWKQERKDLMDRIQAPSFDHYKAAEVRVIKAQKPEEEKPKFEYV